MFSEQKQALETLISQAVGSIPVVYDNMPDIKSGEFIRLRIPSAKMTGKTISKNKYVKYVGVANAYIITPRNTSSIRGNQIAGTLFSNLVDKSQTAGNLRLVIHEVEKLNEEEFNGNYLVDLGIVYTFTFNYQS